MCVCVCQGCKNNSRDTLLLCSEDEEEEDEEEVTQCISAALMFGSGTQKASVPSLKMKDKNDKN